MKKSLSFVFLLISFVLSPLFAVSYGALLDNDSCIASNNDFSQNLLKQSNGIALYLNTPFNNEGTLKFSTEALYRYKLSVNLQTNKNDFNHIVDLDLFKFSGKWNIANAFIQINAGRFLIGDISKIPFLQTSDGIAFGYEARKFKFSAYAGYTGLLNSLNVSMTEKDFSSEQQFYALCPAYIPLSFSIVHKAFMQNNTLGFEIEHFIPITQNKTSKTYATLLVSGPVSSFGNYSFNAIFGLENKINVMFDTVFDINFFTGNFGVLTAGAEYISGNHGGLKPFITVSERTIGNSSFINGVILPKLSYVYTKNNFCAGVTETVVFAVPDETIKFDGFDTSINLIYNLFSDLQISCDLGAYICTENQSFSNYTASIKARFAL